MNDNKKIKILHLISSLNGGGAEWQLRCVIPLLEENGFENHVLYLHGDKYKKELGLSNRQLHYLPVRSNYSPLIILKICSLLLSLKPDIIHSWIVQMDILAGLITNFVKTPWILRETSCAQAWIGSWKFRIREILASNTKAILSNSVGGQSYWKALYPSKYNDIIPNVVQLDLIKSIIPAKKKEYHVDQNQKVILYAGRLCDGKRLDSFIEATIEIVRKNKNIVIVLCGDGPIKDQLENKIEKESLHQHFKFLGAVPNHRLWAIMKSADMFAFFSEFEGMPNAVIEAAACGCPLVLSDIEAHTQLFDHGMARFVSAGSTQNIKEGIVDTLLESPNKVNQRSLTAQKRVQLFNKQRILNDFIILYKKGLD